MKQNLDNQKKHTENRYTKSVRNCEKVSLIKCRANFFKISGLKIKI